MLLLDTQIKRTPRGHAWGGVLAAGEVFHEKVRVLGNRIRVPFKGMLRTEQRDRRRLPSDGDMFGARVVSDESGDGAQNGAQFANPEFATEPKFFREARRARQGLSRIHRGSRPLL